MTSTQRTGERFAGQGPRISATALDRFEQTFNENVRAGDIVLFGGSLPEGVPENAYRSLIARAKAAGARTYIDARGEPLRRALEAAPHFVGVNLAEFAETTGVPMETLGNNRSRVAALAADWVRGGAETVVVTMGGDGIVLVTRDGGSLHAWYARAPKVHVVDVNGAGDTVKVAFAYSDAEGRPLVEALRLAAAASAVTVTKSGAEMSTLAEAESMMDNIEISAIPIPAPTGHRVGVSILLGWLYERTNNVGRAVIALVTSPLVEGLLIAVLFGTWPHVFSLGPWLGYTLIPLASGLFFALIHPEVFDGLDGTPRSTTPGERVELFIEGAIYGAIFAMTGQQAAGWEAWLTALISIVILHTLVNLQAILRGEIVSVGGGGAGSIVDRARRLLNGTALSVDVESIDGRLAALESAARGRSRSMRREDALLEFQRFATERAFAPDAPGATAIAGFSVITIDDSLAENLEQVVARERAKVGATGTILFVAPTAALASRAQAAIESTSGAPAVSLARPELFTQVRGGSTFSLSRLSDFLSTDRRFSNLAVARVVASDAVAFDVSGLGSNDPLRHALFVVLSALGSITLTIGQLDRLATIAALVGRQA